MAERPKDFGRRKPVTKAKKPAKTAPGVDDDPGIPITKRSLAIGIATAGALAGSAMYFLQPAPAEEKCIPTSSAPALGPTGMPLPALESPTGRAATAGGIGGPDPCPPGTRRSSSSSHHYSSSSSGRRSLFWGWSSGSSSSSSASSSSFHPVSAVSSGHTSSSSISRGGFGSIGGHFSGGS